MRQGRRVDVVRSGHPGDERRHRLAWNGSQADDQGRGHGVDGSIPQAGRIVAAEIGRFAIRHCQTESSSGRGRPMVDAQHGSGRSSRPDTAAIGTTVGTPVGTTICCPFPLSHNIRVHRPAAASHGASAPAAGPPQNFRTNRGNSTLIAVVRSRTPRERGCGRQDLHTVRTEGGPSGSRVLSPGHARRFASRSRPIDALHSAIPDRATRLRPWGCPGPVPSSHHAARMPSSTISELRAYASERCGGRLWKLSS